MKISDKGPFMYIYVDMNGPACKDGNYTCKYLHTCGCIATEVCRAWLYCLDEQWNNKPLKPCELSLLGMSTTGCYGPNLLTTYHEGSHQVKIAVRLRTTKQYSVFYHKNHLDANGLPLTPR